MSARDVADLLRELKGTTCQCGADKKSMQSFCVACYFHLPRELRHRIYDKIGEGYEEAYKASVDALNAAEREAAEQQERML